MDSAQVPGPQCWGEGLRLSLLGCMGRGLVPSPHCASGLLSACGWLLPHRWRWCWALAAPWQEGYWTVQHSQAQHSWQRAVPPCAVSVLAPGHSFVLAEGSF